MQSSYKQLIYADPKHCGGPLGSGLKKFISSILQYVSETLIYANSEIDDIEKKKFFL